MNLRKLLIYDEGLRLKPYLCTSNKLTIGVGRNLEDNGISKTEAMIMLDNDILYLNEKFAEFDWFLRLDEVRRAVIISMGFNLGFKGFMSFKNLIKALKNNDYELAVVEMLNSKWANQVKNRAVRLAKMMETGHWPTDIY
jgi:lysozyme